MHDALPDRLSIRLPGDLQPEELEIVGKALQAASAQDRAQGGLHIVAHAVPAGPVENWQQFLVEQARAKREAAAEFAELQVDFTAQMVHGFGDWEDHIDRHGMILELGRDSGQAKRSATMLIREKQRAKAGLQADIRQNYRKALELGKRMAGNPFPADRAEKRLQERLRRNEFAFAENFLDDIASGQGTMDYEQRATLYGNALTEAAWMGFLYGNLRSGRYLRWVDEGDEGECPDCDLLSRGGRWHNGVYTAQELATMAVVPGAGSLTCTTRCRCRLVETVRPQGQPLTKRQLRAAGKAGANIRTDWTGKWKTLTPKAPIRQRHHERALKNQTKREKRS